VHTGFRKLGSREIEKREVFTGIALTDFEIRGQEAPIKFRQLLVLQEKHGAAERAFQPRSNRGECVRGECVR